MKFLNTAISRYRFILFLEGFSLILLVFIAMPFKYFLNDPFLVKVIGQVHGILFMLFLYQTIRISIEFEWKFTETTLKVLLSSFIPFASFYVDRRILRRIEEER